jgi:hypothetical protein
MSKVFDYYNEWDELDEPLEPTDEELTEIELEIDELD